MIGDVFIRAGSDYGTFKNGCVGALIHSLEAPPKPGMARGLIGWLNNEGLSPHTMSDPTPETVQVLDERHAGAHAGRVANLFLVGFEQTGYAAYDFGTWTSEPVFSSIKATARSVARLWRVMGWNPNDVEWGSVGQLQQAVANAQSGRAYRPMLWTHFDVSQAFPGTTNHTDPGKGYPYAIFRQLVKQYLGTWEGSQIGTPADQSDAGIGGAEKKDWFDMADEASLEAVVRKVVFSPEFLSAVAITAWTLPIAGPGRTANQLLLEASAADDVLADLGTLPVKVWTQKITDRAANELLADAASDAGDNPKA